jgi:crossover junction endodeoxyribonuclease RuvC
MRVLGIDPGIARVGFGVVGVQKSSNPTFVECGLITTEPKTDLAQRLLEISQDLDVVIKKTKPGLISCEKLYFQNNAKTAFDVGQARGVILLAAAKHKIDVVEFTPLQVKQVVTGYGKATKKQIEEMIINILHLNFIPKPDDVADAIAIALCGAFINKTRYA